MAIQKQGDPIVAEKILRHNLTIDAMHQPTYHSLAQMMVNQGRTAEAQDLLAGWVATQPYIAAPNIEMAWLQKESGDFPGAEQSLQQALKVQPTNPVALAQLGQLYQAEGRPELAATYYQRSLAAHWDQPEVQSRLATLEDPQFRGRNRSARMQNGTSSPMLADNSIMTSDEFIASGPALSTDPMLVSYSPSMGGNMMSSAPIADGSDPMLAGVPVFGNGLTVEMPPPANIAVPFGSDQEALALEDVNANPVPKHRSRKKGKHKEPVMTTYPLPNFDAPQTAWVPSGTTGGVPSVTYQSPINFQPPIVNEDSMMIGGMQSRAYSPTPLGSGSQGLVPQADPAHIYGSGQEMTASLPVVDPH
jgi:hypothetical protein